MTDRQERIESLFDAAIDVPPGERGPFLDAACAGDAALRAEVESLLQHDAPRTQPDLRRPSDLIDAGAPDAHGATRDADRLAAPSAPQGPAKTPERVGPYRILERLGEGGMGVVYRAEQENPRRVVALKVIRPGFVTAQTLRRFEHEANVLGRLQHPGIAQVFEAGATETEAGPQPYFAMELIDGEPLREHAARRKLGTRQRIELMVEICDAVHHAHQKGVIHRDLKPGNILVDRAGRPKILDFGVARATDSDLQATTLRTDIGQLIGTIQYMSPEQVAADPAQLDTRSDVYALGVILYELLAERMPYEVGGRMLHEAARIIREDDPAPLSSVNRVFRGDVETIVEKALEKEKERRYQSADELAADLRRYLRDEPITARPASALYQLRKLARRHRGLVIGAGLALAALLLGLVGVSWFAWQASTQRDLAVRALAGAERARVAETLAKQDAEGARDDAEARRKDAEQQRARAEAINAFLNDDLLASVDPRRLGRDVLMTDALDAAAEKIEAGAFAEQPAIEAAIRLTLGATYQSLGAIAKADPQMRAAVALHEATFGPRSAETAGALLKLAELLVQEGQYDEAAEVTSFGIEVLREIHGPEHSSVGTALNLLAQVARARGELEQAESLFREALELWQRSPEDNATQIATLQNNLGVILQQRGKLEEAEPLFEEALATRRALFGEHHPDIAQTLNNLAYLYHIRRQFDRAIPLFREALAMNRALLGDGHPDVATSLNNLGACLMAAGQLDEAEPLFQECLAIRRAAYGERHPEIVAAIYQLGYARHLRGDLDGAETAYRDAIAMGEALEAGAADVWTLNAVNNLAVLLLRRGDVAAAEPMQRRVYEADLSVYGPDHTRAVTAGANLATMLAELGRYEEAEPLSRKAVAARRATLAAEDPVLPRSIAQLGICLQGLGSSTEAETLLREALATQRALFPEGDKAQVDTFCGLGAALIDLGRLDEAVPLLQECLRLCADKLPEGHWQSAYATTLLGIANANQGRVAEGEAQWLEGYAGLEAAGPRTAARRRELARRIAALYERLAREDEARVWKTRLETTEPPSSRPPTPPPAPDGGPTPAPGV